MRFLINIILVLLISFTGFATEQYSTKSRTHNTEVPERKENAKVETKKQDVPSRPQREEVKKQDVPTRLAAPAQPARQQNKAAQQPRQQSKPAEQPKQQAKPAEQPRQQSRPAEQPRQQSRPAEQPKPAEQPAQQQQQPQQGRVTKIETNVETSRYDGIDVSRHQKTIDWQRLATDKNVKYVYIKATEGQNFVDPKFRENLENARKAGFKIGCYHFLRTSSPIRAQFENFTRQVKKHEQDLLPLLDVEVRQGWTNQQVRDSVKLFVDLLEDHYGCKPMIYTSSSFFNNILGRLFANYPLFIARYSSTEPRLEGAKWILWQYSDRGRLRGIDHAVDLSRFNKGCTMRDILMKDNKVGHSKRRSSEVVDRDRDKPSQVNVKKEAPTMSKRQQEEIRKQEERERKARERAEKIQRDEERKRLEREQKEAREREKREAREKATRQRVQSNFQNTTDYHKKAQEQARIAREQERIAQEQERARERAEKQKREEERKRLEKEQKAAAARERAAKQERERLEKQAERDRERAAKQERERLDEEARQQAHAKSVAEQRAKAQAKAQAELEQEQKAAAARKAQQQKKQEQKAKLQQQKDASTKTTNPGSATPTRRRTNKSSADND